MIASGNVYALPSCTLAQLSRAPSIVASPVYNGQHLVAGPRGSGIRRPSRPYHSPLVQLS